MKIYALLTAMLLNGGMVFGQTDPVIMKIAGSPVSRSEFEYSYNKNNSASIIDKKSIVDYVDLFINYKLKVKAAEDAHLDTLTSFQKEFESYRDQQVRPSFITEAEVEAIFQKGLKNEPISIEEQDKYKGYILVFLGKEYAKRGWTQQYHIGALRNNSKSMLKKIGPDTGFDAIEDACYMEKLSALFTVN